jgi:hypothetical protein
MTDEPPDKFSRLLLLAPAIFICHFLEESPGFVPWFNEHVSPGITSGLFWRVNLTGFGITLIVVALEWFSRSTVSSVIAIAWLSFLMLANAILHIVAAGLDRAYVPGLLTAIFLYVPYYVWAFLTVIKSKTASVITLVLATTVGSFPMLVHGYLILFRGSRLF